jgi:hypothetical protein
MGPPVVRGSLLQKEKAMVKLEAVKTVDDVEFVEFASCRNIN